MYTVLLRATWLNKADIIILTSIITKSLSSSLAAAGCPLFSMFQTIHPSIFLNILLDTVVCRNLWQHALAELQHCFLLDRLWNEENVNEPQWSASRWYACDDVMLHFTDQPFRKIQEALHYLQPPSPLCRSIFKVLDSQYHIITETKSPSL